MSGICAVFRKQDASRTAEVVRAMCRGLSLDPSESRAMAAEECGAVGVSAVYPTQQIFQDDRFLVAYEADFVNETELWEAAGVEPGAGIGSLLARLYERFGTGFPARINGEFSIVIWEKRKRTLFAATDGFGIHPLVYHENERSILVASRIDALLASGEVSAEIHPHALANYVNYTVNLAAQTIISKVHRLLPGTFLAAGGGRLRTERYWDMTYTTGRGDEEALSRGLEAVVQQAVKDHAERERFSELGAFLSGGTDSSTVVGMMSRLQRGPVKTFSIGFEERRFNELDYARIAARKFQADYHEYLVSAKDCVEALPYMVRYFDEPFGNSSAIPTYFCARLAAENGVRAMLAGDGGDELFGGNERYLTDSVFEAYQKVPRIVRKGVVEPVLRAIPARNGVFGLARSYVRRSNLPQPERFFSYNLLAENPASTIFDPDFVAALGDYSVLEIPSRYYWEGPAHEHLDRLLYVDVKITLGDNDLLKVTRMSELAGVRPKFPLLDRRVAEFSGTIPSRLKVKGSQKRYLFKKAFRELLPIDIIQKKKHGFGIPVAYWMKSDPQMRELTRDVLLSARTYQRGHIRKQFIEDLLLKHEDDKTAFYGDLLWIFLTLELWFREFVDEPRWAAAA